jgi:O-antigen/teichoic acid export membrane protein
LNFFKAFGIYTVTGFATKAISFLLLPFFTHYLTQADYGLITIFSNTFFLLAPLMSMGIGETFTVEYPRFQNKDMSGFISTSILVPLVGLPIMMAIVWLFHQGLTNLTGLSENILYLICWLNFFNFFCDYLFSILRNQNRPVFFGVMAVVKTTLELSLAIYFIGFCRDGYIGRVKSIFINILIISLFGIFFLVKNRLIVFNFSKKWLVLILKRGFPAIPLFFMSFTMYNCDTFMVNYFYGPSKAGLYGLSGQFAFILTVVTTAFITPFYPFLYENLMNGNRLKVVSLVMRYILFLTALLIGLAVFTPVVFRFFISPKFHPALYYLLLLLAGQYFYSLYLILVGLIYYKRHNHIYYFICPLVILFTISADYILLHIVKVTQYAITSALCYFFCLMLVAGIYQKYIRQALKLYFKRNLKVAPAIENNEYVN